MVLALSNDTIVAADIRNNSDWLERAFVRQGFSAQQLPNAGKPQLYAEYLINEPGARTVRFNMQLDGQPVVLQQWSQLEPSRSVVKCAGGWVAANGDKAAEYYFASGKG